MPIIAIPPLIFPYALVTGIEAFSVWLCREMVGGVAFFGALVYFVGLTTFAAVVLWGLRKKQLSFLIFAITTDSGG